MSTEQIGLDPSHSSNQAETRAIQTRRNPECAVCGREGDPLYAGLKDRLFGAPGEWSLKRCPSIDCGLVWLDPIPLESDIGRAYAAYYTHRAGSEKISRLRDLSSRVNYRLRRIHLRSRFGDRGEHRRAAAILTWLALGPYPPTRAMVEFPMRYLPRPKTGRILEIGFGHGRTIEQLRELGWNAEGLETDAVTVDNARLRGLKVSCGSLIDQDYPSGHFDAIVSNHVLEHAHGPRLLLQESRRILHAGGRFIAATPNAASWGHRVFGADWRGLEPPPSSADLHTFVDYRARAQRRLRKSKLCQLEPRRRVDLESQPASARNRYNAGFVHDRRESGADKLASIRG